MSVPAESKIGLSAIGCVADPNSVSGDSGSSVARAEVLFFICYRRDDGQWHADWIDRALNGWEYSPGVRVKTYYDRTAPAVGDWTKYHFPSLQSAHGLIVICTPGVAKDLSVPGKPDWVYKEVNWWVANRGIPPIVIDSTADGQRWMPDPILRKWRHINRVPLIKNEAESGRDKENVQYLARWKQQIAHTLDESAKAKSFEDVRHLSRLTKRLRVLVLGLLCALLITASLTATAYYNYRSAEAARATAQSLNRFLSGLFYQADPDHTQGQSLTAGQLLMAGEREAAISREPPAVRTDMLVAIGAAYTGIGEHEKAVEMLTKAHELAAGESLSGQSAFNLALVRGEALLYQDQYGEARPELERALALSMSLKSESHAEQSHALVALGDLHTWSPNGDRTLAKQLYEQALEVDRTAKDRLNEARDQNRLGYLANKMEDAAATMHFAAARELVREAGSSKGSLLFAKYDHDYATTLYARGDLTGAASAFEDAREQLVAVYGSDSGEVAIIDSNLARLAIEQAEAEGTEERLTKAIENIKGEYGEDYADLSYAFNSLALMQMSRLDYGAAKRNLELALEIAEVNEDWRIAVQSMVHQSEIAMADGQYAAAKVLLDRAKSHFTKSEDAHGWRYALYQSALAELSIARCDLEVAGELLERTTSVMEDRWQRPNVFHRANERRRELLQTSRSDASRCGGQNHG